MKANYHNSQVDEILRVPPRKLIGYSTILVSLGLLVFFAIGVLVSIPEESGGKVQIFNSHAFVNIYSTTGGRVAKLFVRDKDPVGEGDLLALIDNPLAFEEYQVLQATLKNVDSILKKLDTLALVRTTLPEFTSLGNMQSTYQGLQKCLQQITRHTLSTEYAEQKTAIQKKQQIYLAFTYRLDEQEKLLDMSVAMKTKNLERNTHLHLAGLISDAEIESIEAEVLSEKMKLEDVKTDKLDNELKIQECSKQMIELSWQYSNERDKQYLGVASIHKQLQEQLQLWEEKYLIRAPVSGTVQLTDFWEEQQHLNAGEVVMTVLPSNNHNISAKMRCPAGQATKVRQGNDVLIEMQGFPAMTHGYVKGRVGNISEVPLDGMYIVDIILSDGLNTTLGNSLQFNRYAEGQAKIIIERKAFLMHLIEKILPAK